MKMTVPAENGWREPYRPALDVAARMAWNAHCMLTGQRDSDPRNEIGRGDVDILKAAIRADETPAYVKHALDVANSAWGTAVLTYSNRGGKAGRSGPPRPPWRE
jgi:hypothetical protein